MKMKMYSRGPRGRTRNAIGLQGRVGSNPTIFARKFMPLLKGFFLFGRDKKMWRIVE